MFYKWWSNCSNMLILRLVYPRVSQRFWDGSKMLANIFVPQHGDQAKKGMYQPNLSRLHFGQRRLSTYWHNFSPVSVVFGLDDVMLQYSVSSFVISVLRFEKMVKYIFIINYFVIHWGTEVYITLVFAKFGPLDATLPNTSSRNLATVVFFF